MKWGIAKKDKGETIINQTPPGELERIKKPTEELGGEKINNIGLTNKFFQDFNNHNKSSPNH